MADRIKSKLFSSMERSRTKFTSSTKVGSNLNPSYSAISVHSKKTVKSKLEYELRVLVGHAMVLDRLTEEIENEDYKTRKAAFESYEAALNEEKDEDEDDEEEVIYYDVNPFPPSDEEEEEEEEEDYDIISRDSDCGGVELDTSEIGNLKRIKNSSGKKSVYSLHVPQAERNLVLA
ncbi:hypothetical protein QEN19_001065 [Hanseniaspora menglaensis]